MKKKKFTFINTVFLIIIFIPLFKYTLEEEESELDEKMELIKFKTLYTKTVIADSIRKLRYTEMLNKERFEENEIKLMQEVKDELLNNFEIHIEDIFKITDEYKSRVLGDEGDYDLHGYSSLNKSLVGDQQNVEILNKAYIYLEDSDEINELVSNHGIIPRKMYFEIYNNTVFAYIIYPFYTEKKLSSIYGVKLDIRDALEIIAQSKSAFYKEAYYTDNNGFIIRSIYTPLLKKIFFKNPTFFYKSKENQISELINKGYEVRKLEKDDYQIISRVNVKLIFVSSLIIAFICAKIITFVIKKIIKYIEKYNARYHKSIIDPLTNLYNRAGFYEFFNKEFLVSAMAIFDIDDFKKVNDTYGHHVGDLVLIEVSNILEKNICGYQKDNKVIKNCSLQDNFCVRWGGEELLVTMKSIDATNFLDILEKIRLEIESATFKDYPTLRITTSIGATVKKIDSMAVFEKTFETIDANLYEAKKTGKNKIVFSQEGASDKV